MPHEASLLQTAVVFLLAAVLVVPLAKRLQLGAVLGYLLAGVLIGPAVLRLVDDPAGVSHISELGVVLLLFIIGLELSPRRLWVMRQAVFGVACELHRDWRNDIEGLGALFSNHIPDYRNLINSYTTLTAGK